MFISFFYRIGEEKERYLGKIFFSCMSDDHDGLDVEVRPYLLSGLNSYREIHGLPILDDKDLQIAVISFSFEKVIPVYSTDDEIPGFDFYMRVKGGGDGDYYTNQEIKTYVNGKYIELCEKYDVRFFCSYGYRYGYDDNVGDDSDCD